MEADIEAGHKPTKRILWGVFLMLLGAAFLVERMGGWDGTPIVKQFWPLVFFVIGADNLLERRPGGALMFFVFGAWFLACNFGLWGMTIHNSWPITLVAVGAGIVGGSLSGEDQRRHRRRKEARDV